MTSHRSPSDRRLPLLSPHLLSCLLAPAVLLWTACGGERSTEIPETIAGHCSYTSRFTDLPECNEYLGDTWTEPAMKTDCEDAGGTLTVGRACDASGTLGACILEGGTEQARRAYVVATDSDECKTNERGCELFGGGAWVASSICGGTDVPEPENDGPVFIPPTLTCKAPLAGEPMGQSEEGDVCTWNMISGSTEEGRKFKDYASCETVRTQRPYYPANPNTARVGQPDERLEDADYVKELTWVKSQIESSACVCCHSSEITPEGPSNWYIEAPGNFMDSFYDTGLAMGANYVPSRELGAYPPEQNNGFDRLRSGFPSTDPERMVRFFQAELAHRGREASDFEGRPYTAGPLGAQLDYVPGQCEDGEGVARGGVITWGGGPARYLYVLEEKSDNPGVPPNLDIPDGTLWRVDVAPEGEVLRSGELVYGEEVSTRQGVSVRVPEGGAPPLLEPGKTYYLYVLADIAIPITRCLFTYD